MAGTDATLTRGVLHSIEMSEDEEIPTDRNHLLPKDGQIQNVKDARVYVFGEEDFATKSLSESVELGKMRQRSSPNLNSMSNHSSTSDMLHVEYCIQSDDTLQKVALKYACQISELRRINNIITDQDFYGKKVIKIPIKAHGILSEEFRAPATPSVHKPNNKKTGIDSYIANDTDSECEDESKKLLVKQMSIQSNLSSQSQEAAHFLHKMDADINSIVSSTSSRKDTLEEVMSSLAQKRISPLVSIKKKSMWNTVDCGINWKGIVLCMVIVAIVTPLLYFFYFEYLQEPKHDSSAAMSTPSIASPRR